MTPKAQKNLEYTLAAHELKGLLPSDYAISLCERMAAGEITADEAVDTILKHYNINNGKNDLCRAR